jgi:predicted AlkP superfamily phosphohydrolase/phosphomutase
MQKRGRAWDMTRVAAIGLDAAEWSFVERLIQQGQLPNLAKIRDRSAECRLRNVVAYRSELPYTQFVTGKEAATNRYWSTVGFDPLTYTASEVGAHHARPFYALGSGVKVIAFDVPHSVLADDVDGVQITAWGAHSPQYPRAARPAGLLRQIDAKFGVHPAFDNDYAGSWYQPQFIENLANCLTTGAVRRVDIAQWLQQEYEWDLLLTVMSESHSSGHHMWHGADEGHVLHDASTAQLARDSITRVYRCLDEQVGRFSDGLPDDTVLIVFAVHGMQVNQNDVPSIALLPELLYRLNFGHSLLGGRPIGRWRRNGCPPVMPDPHMLWTNYVRGAVASTPLERVRRDMRLALPPHVVQLARQLRRRLRGQVEPRDPWDLGTEHIAPESDMSPEEMAASRNSLDWQFPSAYRQYWPQMRAFVLPTFSDAHVRLNIRGRERDGMIDLEDYESACRDLEREIRSCRDVRTGKSVVDEVIRMRDTEPMDPEGPDSDLVVVWSTPVDAIEHPRAGVIGPMPFQRTGEHSSNGWAFISGPGVEPGDVGEHSAFDLPPTILTLLGADVPADLAGTPIITPAPA